LSIANIYNKLFYTAIQSEIQCYTCGVSNTAITVTKLSGRWLLIGRLLWSLLFALCLTLLFASLIIISPIVQSIQQTYPPGLETILATAPLLRRYALVVAFYATSFLVFRQRSGELGPLFMACFYMGLGTVPLATGIFNLTAGVMVVPPALDVLAVVMLSLGVLLSILSVYVFPDGRFTPEWSHWLRVPAILAAIAYGIGFYTVRQVPLLLFGVLVCLVLIGAYSQFYRYQHATNSQRQQIKWYMYGVFGFVIGQTAAILIQRQIGPLTTLPALLWSALSEILFFLSYLLVVLTNLIAIVRYRLFDINYVINRSIVYAGVTLLLGGLFTGAFFGLQFLLDVMIGGEQPVISAGLAGALIISIFQPVRRQTRRLVDRRFYGIELDYTGKEQPPSGPLFANGDDRTGTFGAFREMNLIGRGGMGEVYRAIDATRQMPVAIKLLKEAGEPDAEVRRRFRREAQTIARLQHPNIVTLYDVGEQDETLYMVMEYVAGHTLAQLLREKGKLSLSETAVILKDVAAALDYAHDMGVIHRDIKPSNIIVEAETGRAALVDFGIAKIVAETNITQSGGLVGTLDYIAPEQIQGVATVDKEADIYSLGVMVYQMLTGELPFRQNNPGAIVMAHLMQPPPDPREREADLPASVSTAVMRAMNKKPEQRFASAGEMVTSLLAKGP
jgi:predicted Ser/Thr protein kinase